MTAHYRLVYRGKTLPGLLPEQVAANLAALFRITPAQAAQLLAAPAIIKQDIDSEAAGRYQEALAEAGLITHLEALEAEAAAVPSADSSAWDGVERRQGQRRHQRDRRDVRRSTAIQPDRRQRGRRHDD